MTGENLTVRDMEEEFFELTGLAAVDGRLPRPWDDLMRGIHAGDLARLQLERYRLLARQGRRPTDG